MAVTNKRAVLPLVLILACAASGAQMHRDVEYARPGSVSLTLDAAVPEMGVGPFPAAIIVHGGGFTAGSKEVFVTPLFKPLSDARFVWFSINYRLAPQFPMAAAVGDVEAAVEWVRAHADEYKVDPKRIVLIGESAGAFLVDAVGVNASKKDRVAAVVSFYGPHDLYLQVREKGQGKIGQGLAAFTGVKEFDAEGQKQLKELSPINSIHGHPPPFLLIHGTEDELVPYDQSVFFRRALQNHHGQCDLIAVEGGKHGMVNWEKEPGQQDYKTQMIEWLRATLH